MIIVAPKAGREKVDLCRAGWPWWISGDHLPVCVDKRRGTNEDCQRSTPVRLSMESIDRLISLQLSVGAGKSIKHTIKALGKVNWKVPLERGGEIAKEER